MYKFIKDKEFLKRMRHFCSGIINQLVQIINSEPYLNVQAHLVGSGAKKLETQNENEPIDLDYNLVIINSNIDSGKEIKEYIMNMFNYVLRNNDLKDCSDSKSCLSTKKMKFKTDNQTEFSIDLAIVFEDRNNIWHRLIHEKTGCVNHDRWIWNVSPDSKSLNKKVAWIKNNNLWNEVRNTYLKKKNMYLKQNNYEHSSFICYIESVNEVYNKN